MPPPPLPRNISTESLGSCDWEQLFPRGWENRYYDQPILGSASERNAEQKKRANAYALALATCAQKQVAKHESSVVCATDGACQTSFGPSVLEESRFGIKELWTRQGGGAGAAIAGRDGQLLAAFGTRHGHVNDSAADEMAGMHAVLIALVSAYLGNTTAAQIDLTGISSEAAQRLKWKTKNRQPPPCLKIEKGKTTIIISCDNQEVAKAARTEGLKAMPHRGGTARAPGHAMHNEIVRAKRELTDAGASVQIVWVPGHTDTCALNIEADEFADQAAVSSGYTSLGGNNLTTTRPMLKNHMKRRARQLLNNSWYHWYLEQQCSPYGRRKASGHAYLVNMVLWIGPTVNWFDDEAVRQENARPRPRWLAMPEEIGFASKSYQAAKSIVRLRLNLATKNVKDARSVGIRAPKCPWCNSVDDNGRHRFECRSLQHHRDRLVGRLRAVTTPKIKEPLDGQTVPTSDDRSDREVMNNFTWDIMVKGDFSFGDFYDMERFTAPTVETRMELADMVHTFLRDTMFYTRVFGQRADCGDVVVQACKEQRAAEKRAEEALAATQQDVAPATPVAQQARRTHDAMERKQEEDEVVQQPIPAPRR
jgi:hypothetical protein